MFAGGVSSYRKKKKGGFSNTRERKGPSYRNFLAGEEQRGKTPFSRDTGILWLHHAEHKNRQEGGPLNGRDFLPRSIGKRMKYLS